jgi:putative DNA primase/helicase
MPHSAYDIAKVLDPDYERTGSGFKCRCPAHNDNNPSLHISDGKDGKILVHCHTGCDARDVIAELKARNLWPEAEKPDKAKPARKGKINIIKTYDYFDPETGELRMQVCRLDPKDFRQRRPDPNSQTGRSWSVPAEHRILYNLVAVSKLAPEKVVLIVEGEKDVDRLAQMGIVATCNPGGAGKWFPEYNKWLAGRHVVLVPDNDPQMVDPKTKQPKFHRDGRPVHVGQDHMDDIGAQLQGVAASVKILHLPELPLKGDVYDWIEAGGTREQLGRLVAAAPAWSPPVAPERPAPDTGLEPVTDINAILKKSHLDAANDNKPFRWLGIGEGNVFYYLSAVTQQILPLAGSAHTKRNLMVLAPLAFWEERFPAKLGFAEDAAVNWLMGNSGKMPMFDPDKVRGCGAWWDDGRVVVHAGDKLYVDKTPTDLGFGNSRYTYENRPARRINIDDPLPVAEARKFLELNQMMPWTNDLHALYSAGWCVVAPIGGVLDWRPNIWVTGSKGSGKSYVMSKLINRSLGDNRLFVASSTTEAGIRQSLRRDAIPVLFDEAEGEDRKAVERVQNVLSLVRSSSSETGADIAKGTSGGNAMSFKIRSCFAFSSINASIVQQSDASRFVILELSPRKRQHDQHELARRSAFMTDEYISRFQARSIAMAAVIRHNAAMLGTAVAAYMGEQRAGDLIGPLLAGAYALMSDDRLTYEQAEKWVGKLDLGEQKAEVESMSDEQHLLDYLMQQKLTRVPTIWGDKDLTVFEVITMSRQDTEPGNKDRAEATLNRLGIKTDGDQHIIVSNTADGIRRLLEGTPWSVKWGQTLKRLPDAYSTDNTTFGASGIKPRAVKVYLPIFR